MIATASPPESTSTGQLVVSRGCLIATLAGAIGLAAWLPKSPGPGVFLVIVAFAAGLAVLLAGGAPRNLRSAGLAATAVALVLMSAVRSAEWLVIADLLFALCFVALAVADANGWSDAITGLLAPSARLPQVPSLALRSAAAALGSTKPGAAARLVRSLLPAALLVTVFGALFASADAAFAELTGNLIPRWDLGLIPLRTAIAALASAITLAFALVAVAGPPRWLTGLTGHATSLSFKLSRLEWMVVLGTLNALFLAFGILQVLVLFRGHSHVLETAGLTYAEYARTGFLQLLLAAALTIPVVVLTWVWAARTTDRDSMVLKALLGSLCVLTLLIVVSALRRLGLYEEAFGFTRSRLAAHGVALWLGAVLVAILIAGAARRTRFLFRVTLAMTAAALLAFNLINPDAAIAKRNWERYVETGKVDVDYLSGLSSDAIPFIATLPSTIKAPVLEEAARRIPRDEPWSSANLSRIQARRVLEENRLL